MSGDWWPVLLVFAGLGLGLGVGLVLATALVRLLRRNMKDQPEERNHDDVR